MPPSPTDYPSVITVENAEGLIASVIYPRQYFFAARRLLQDRQWLFFFPDRISNRELPTISISTDSVRR
jgi:hypothetical protein